MIAMTATEQVRILERRASVRPLDRDEARSLHEARIMAEMEAPALERRQELTDFRAALVDMLRERYLGVPTWMWMVVATQAVGWALTAAGVVG